MALACAFAIIAPCLAQVAPPADEAPPPLRRIADVNGRPLDDDRPRKAGQQETRTTTATFDPLEVRRIDLQAVEPSIGDRGPLDLSLRWIDPGLRLPSGYDQVYAQEGSGFWRANGGLLARFDQSIYMSTQYGPMADIPASTVFVIGGVPMGGEVGHGRLLAVDPLDPGLVPELSGPVSVPDEWHSPSAIPGDRFARFGFGPGYRVPVRADSDALGFNGVSSRFQADPDYRAMRIARLLSHWRSVAGDESAEDSPIVSPGDSSSEGDPSNSAAGVASPDRAS